MLALVVYLLVFSTSFVTCQTTVSGTEITELSTVKYATTISNETTSVSNTIVETVFAPRDILSRRLPAPTRLAKVLSTTTKLILTFRPPGNYLNDARYSHFRLEYEDTFGKKNIELDKSQVNTNRVILTGLRSGVLYSVGVRTQGKDARGNYLLSPVLITIKARTDPPQISNLKIIPIGGTLVQALVAWDGPPTSPRGPQYDLFTLSYRITSSTQRAKRPINIPYRPGNAFIPNAAKNITQVIDVEPGATYWFSVVTRSTGDDPTKSLPIEIKHKFPLPGPVNVEKRSTGETWLSIEWENHKDVRDVTEYIVTYEPALNRNTRRTSPRNISLPADVTTHNLTGLDPGTLYQISVKYLRKNEPFGKESDEITIYARTSPQSPNVRISNIDTSEATLDLAPFQKGQIDSIFVDYELVRNEKRSPKVKHDIDSQKLVVRGLVPGELYRITITFSSDGALEVDKTTSSTTILIRTTPNPPESFAGSSKQGKIILQWNKSAELEPPTTWTYEIVYYPADMPDQVSRQVLWNRNGTNRMSYSLDNLIPGTRYEILLYCEVGEDAENDRVTRSSSVGPLTIFTQPNNPLITSWTQITLSQVRLKWTPPGQSVASFDYYLLNLTQIYSADSAIEFKPEYLSYKVDRLMSEKILKLSFGATYRVVLTTVVGEGEIWMQSVVNASNSKLFETWSPYDSHQLFSLCVWKFTACGQLGRFGPNQVLCDFEYDGTALDKLVAVEEGIQHWVAPIDGLYRITAAGAGYQGPGGKGATVSGLVHLTEGSRLKIAAGQQGDYDGDDMTQGGGGGSFVVSEEKEPLVIAGGAGTANELATPSPISNGRLNHTGGDASVVGQGFGRGGSTQDLGPGLPGSQNAAGGAGFRGVSESAVNFGDTVFSAAGFLPFYYDEEDTNETDRSLIVPLVGGRYELQNGGYSEGGFGGGGSGYKTGAGGGGGYTGGGGGPQNGYSGGGGSYIQFTGGTQYAEVVNVKSGYVEISLVGLPVKSPIPVALYLTVAFLVGIGITVCFGGILCWVDRCAGGRLSRAKPDEELIFRNRAASPGLYDETSVNVTDASPNMSGLFVRSVGESEPDGYRKYSEVDSDDFIHTPLPHTSIPPRIEESDEMGDEHGQHAGDRFQEDEQYTDSEEEQESESTPSPVSSYRSDIDKITNDVYAWDIREDGDGEDVTSSSASDGGHVTDDSEQSSLPPPPTPPPLLDGVGERQKAKFRKSSQMFQRMQNPPS